MKRLWVYYFYLLLIWGSFRYFVRLPEVIEELWFKPVLWLTPLFWWNMSLTDRVMMFGKRGWLSLGLGLMVGLGYWILMRFDREAFLWPSISIVGVGLTTAVSEEITFSGFVAGYLEKIKKGKWTNLILVGVMTAVIRLPILLFLYQAKGTEVSGVLLVAFSSGVINAWIRVKTGSVLGSIVSRWGMNLAVLG